VNSLTGPFAVIGRPMVAGANAYFRMINDQGGVGGRQVRLVALDDQLNPDIGVAHARKLVADGAPLLLAPISSGVSGALLPVLAESKVPMIAYTGVEALENDPNYFAVGLTTTQTLYVAANYIKSVATGTPKIAFLTFESPASNTARDAVGKLVEKWGWKVVEMQTYRGGATDYNTQALKIAAAQPDYIIGSMIDGQAPQLFSALQRAGNKATIVNFHAGAAENVFAAIASPLFLAMRDVPDPREPDAALKPLRDAAQKYGLTADMTSAVFTKGWLSAQLAVDALKSCGSACTSQKLADHLMGLTAFDTAGVTAKLAFSKTKRIGLNSARIYRWDPAQNRAVPITGQIEATAN
jgi:branched-chain amino acid transport system substrate-binding protein